ncbi:MULTISPECIES: ATP-dependent Clp protease ATP-binding subunit [unclassified Fusibacter]|uniref:ATP-dependent Clp protease ATP-binding subunit n=1 Tax=unclassified Fusibacter TaxID=2624464 RepID=UPI00101092C0|nr:MULTISPECIES: AAA family ATPase [unclassified Fusibacter]MCK8059344.1 AAA family ATPase [Fusibacter sp. A2]NPE21192.1 AAA domain-containing protein [Fusibacter sp. A1]RXV62460.1 AAA family ATPase [Fusibacter sp. A1]
MKKCSICNKNIAIMYTTKIENGKSTMQGICMDCANKMGIPIMDELMKQVDFSPEDMENISKQMQKFMEEQDPEQMEDNPLFNMIGMNQDEDFEDEDEEEEFEVEVKDKEVSSQSKKRKKRKNLDKFGENLNEKAAAGGIDRVIGRSKEIERVMHILNRRTKNNPILIGEPGVGKTAIAEGLALKIAAGSVPEKLLDAEIYLLDLTSIVAGTQFRGQFEGRMKAIIKEAQETGNIILVIDEVHNIMGAGEVHGGVMNAANILKPALAKGEIQVIGATTMEEYRKHIEKDAALERRFQPVVVDEPTVEESIEILKGIKSYYADYHRVDISDEVVEQAVIMSNRYVTDRFLPDKAIDVIDEAGAMVNLKNRDMKELKELQSRLKEVIELKEEASIHDHFEDAANYKSEEVILQDKIESLRGVAEHHLLTVSDVAYVIEAWTKIPVTKITEEEAKKLLHLEERLHHRVIGQNTAVSGLARAIRRSRAGFKKRKKPASFIFVGPTGVGKTELAKTLAEELFGSEEAMIRLDMSEFMEKHTVSKLIGAPPGYVGYDQGGQLTEKIRRRPYSVILMDEMEKAHPDVFNMLLQILEDGRLTDSQGRTVFFENAVIIMTSNAGTALKSSGIGFSNNEKERRDEKLKDALKDYFRPEFLNRVDEIVVFDHLKKEEVRQIVDLQLSEVYRDASEKGIQIVVDEATKDYLAEKGYDHQYGARPLRRQIQRMIEDEIAELYLRGLVPEEAQLSVTFDPQAVKLLFAVK